MKYNFDEQINRYGSHCVKYDAAVREYNDAEMIGMGIADSDFAIAPFILTQLKKSLDHRVFGYADPDPELYKTICDFLERKAQWKVEPHWLCVATGILSILGAVIQQFTEKGDQVLFHSPGYYCIYDLVLAQKREPLISPLRYNELNGGYSFDFDDMEKKITPRTKIAVLVNPHNPTGRVWTKEELTRFADICVKNNIIIFSDDVQAFTNFPEFSYTSVASISKEISDQTISAMSPGKLFDLTGLMSTFFVASNPDLYDKTLQGLVATGAWGAGRNVFALSSLRAAYSPKNDQWAMEKIAYIQKSMQIVDEFLEANIPEILRTKSESTFLAWMNISKLGLTDLELHERLISEAHVKIVPGKAFGSPGFIRMNIGCTHLLLIDVLNRLLKVLR